MREKGQGTVYQKDGAWISRLRFTDELGRPREKTMKASTKAEATARLKTFRNELAAGKATVDKDISVGELFDRLLAEVYTPKLRSSTVVQYEGMVRNHLRPIKDAKLAKLTVQALEEILRDKTIGRRTREMIRRLLICSFGHVCRLGLAKDNIAKKTLPVGGQAKLVSGLSAEEVRAILANASNPLLRLAFRTQVELGLRVGELLGLDWNDLDEGEKTIAIRQQIQRDRRTKKLVLGPLETAKSRRVLPVSDGLLVELHTLKRTCAFIFPIDVAGPMDPRNYNRALAQAANRAKVGHVSSHML